MNKAGIILVMMILLTTSMCLAKEKGQTTAAFLKIASGARAAALGEAYVGLANDVTATYWNPAGLFQLENTQVLFMYLTPMGKVNDLSYNHLSIAVPKGIKGAFGASVSYYGYGEMDRYIYAIH